jgi:LuxR family quorum sensing-dependent transcriptional regulator
MREIEKNAFDTIDRIKKSRAIDDVYGILQRTSAEYGFTRFLVTGVPLPGETLAQHVVLSGWSSAWMDRYNGGDYVHVDPVANRIRRSPLPFRWSDVKYDPKKHPRGHRVMLEAAEFGMPEGYTVPIYGYDGYQACVTMGGQPEDVSDRELEALHLISIFGFTVARALRADLCTSPRREIRLTEREIEVLKWISIGKTSWEIGCVLNISERTVEYHLKAISQKMNVVSRTHAVAEAIRSGIIH